jgi:hypothetical protein
MMQRFDGRFTIFTVGLAICMAAATLSRSAEGPNDPPPLDRLMQLHKDGNYKEAYEGLSSFVLSKEAAPSDLPKALDTAIACLQQLNRTEEIDAFREQAVDAHPQNWWLLAAVAKSYLRVGHVGYLIAGEFHRGPHRGGGKVVDASARDRVRTMQLYRQAMNATIYLGDTRRPAAMLKEFAEAIQYGGPSQAWRLQSLTDLETLPDFEEGWRHYGGTTQEAPVDAEGNPIFYAVPKSWDDAKNDGERWRWVLKTMVEWDPTRRDEERAIRARFLHSQFGVETMAEYRILLARGGNDESGDQAATWALDTLGEDETIARLATGIKRFKLRLRTARRAWRPSAIWRESSRTAGNIPARPSIGEWPSIAARVRGGLNSSSASTRSSVTGASSRVS